MTKRVKKSSGLKGSKIVALNDIVIIEEDPIRLERDDRSGLTPLVIEAIKSSKLVLPETTEYYATKFPFTGIVVAKGPDCKIKSLTVGSHVMFPRMGGMRWQRGDKQMINIKEDDIHGLLND